MIPVRACVVVVLALLFPSFVAAAPCDFRRNGDMRFRVTAYDVASDFTDVWVATGHGVALWQRSAGILVSSGSIAVPGTTLALAPAAGGVWAGSGRGVYFIERASPLRITSSLQLDAEVNDLAIAGSWLYAATSSGIVQVDAVDRARPAVGKRLNTTSGSALSVAILGQYLYAADGDRTVEVYAIGTPAIPQKVGTFDALPRSLAVQSAGDNLFVSDGQRTEVFGGSGSIMTRLSSLPFGATAVGAGAGSLRFVAGSDRTVRAIDVLAPAPTVLATTETDLTAGTVNRVTALAMSGSLLIASAGDAGVAAWTFSSFAAPYASASIEVGAVGSGWVAAERAVVAPQTGGLRRYTESSGIMNPGPAWEQGAWEIHDGDGSAVLAASGATLQLWDSAAALPASISSATLGGAIIGAAMTGTRKAVALLADRTAWSVDLAQPGGVASKLAVAGSPSFVAASSGGVAFGEITPAGSTVIRYYRGGEITAPAEATIEGISSGGIALSSSGVAAAATFRGIALVDLGGGGAPRYVAGSNAAPIRDLEIEGENLLALESGRLQVRRVTDGSLVSTWDLTGEAEQVQASGDRAIVAGSNGFTIINTSRSPATLSSVALTQDEPRIVRSVERDGSLLWLVEKSRADLFSLDALGLPRAADSFTYEETIVASAAARGNLYTLSAGGKLIGRDSAGRTVAQLTIAEGADQQMNGMQAVAGALWVSLTRGCGSGGCEKKALVIDTTAGLVIDGSLPGGILDAASNGERAWAVSDTPREIRVYDLSSPTRPSLVSAAAVAGEPVSIAHGAGFVWTLGSKLQRYSETLQPQAEFLEPWTSDPSGRVTYIDQKIRAAGECLIVVGREPSPLVYQLSGGTPQQVAAPASAGAVRGIIVADDSIQLLGETFLEGWTTSRPLERTRLLRR